LAIEASDGELGVGDIRSSGRVKPHLSLAQEVRYIGLVLAALPVVAR
jgi:hypothetical protein